MRKIQEQRDLDSCLNKAGTEEMVFVLLSRDPAAPSAIRSWCANRIMLNLNSVGDEKITEALRCADTMEKEQAKHKPNWQKPKARPADPCDRPMSAKGLTSYRFKGTFGWVMIGATSHKDALSEAKRSTDAPITMSRLQVWSDKKQQYIAAR